MARHFHRVILTLGIKNMNAKLIYGIMMAACVTLGFGCYHREVHPLLFPDNLFEANPDAYGRINDATDWENPYLIVRPNGVEVLHVNHLVEPDNLKATLASLPSTAWPYGRIVVVQEIGVRSENDDQMISEVLKQVLSNLQALNITVLRWPSS